MKYICSTTRIWKRACCHVDARGGLIRTENYIPCERMLVHLQIRRCQSLLQEGCFRGTSRLSPWINSRGTMRITNKVATVDSWDVGEPDCFHAFDQARRQGLVVIAV